MRRWNIISLCLCIQPAFSWVTAPAVPKKLTALKSAVPEIKTFTENYMPPEILPPAYNRMAGSTHRLSRLEIQKAMNDVKRFVEARLESDLHLTKVSSRLRTYFLISSRWLLTFERLIWIALRTTSFYEGNGSQ
jgi:hypothetical protein